MNNRAPLVAWLPATIVAVLVIMLVIGVVLM
jgi:hypothetical protein